MRRRHFIGALGATTLLAGCARSAGPRPIAIGNAAGSLNQTLAEVMRRQGLLQRFEVAPEIIEVADSTRIVRGIVGGTLAGSLMSGLGQVFAANEHGAELRIIGGAINRPTLALYTTRPEIRTLADLSGKVIGSGSVGALVHQLTITLLRKAGIPVDQVRFVSIGTSAEVFRAVRAGTVDAGVGPASSAEDAQSLGVRAIEGGNMAEQLPEFTYAGAWSSAAVIARERIALVRLLAAHATLYRLLQSPDGHQPFIAARQAVLPQATAQEHEAEWRFLDRLKPLASGLLLEPARLEYLQDINLQTGQQARRLPIEQVADFSLAREALQLSGA